MKKYHNNLFYNFILPLVLFIAINGCAIAFIATNQFFYLVPMLILVVLFKFIYFRLEQLSLQHKKELNSHLELKNE